MTRTHNPTGTVSNTNVQSTGLHVTRGRSDKNTAPTCNPTGTAREHKGRWSYKTEPHTHPHSTTSTEEKNLTVPSPPTPPETGKPNPDWHVFKQISETDPKTRSRNSDHVLCAACVYEKPHHKHNTRTPTPTTLEPLLDVKETSTRIPGESAGKKREKGRAG